MKKILWWSLGIIVLLIIFAGLSKPKKSSVPSLASTSATTTTTIQASSSRSFHMGITFWPPDTDTKAILDNLAFVKQNEDLNVYQQLGGVPWVEAAQNTLPQNVTNDWSNFKSEFNSSRPTYITLTPLNSSRDGMALYSSGNSDANPLPAPWSGYKLNDPAVEQAYLNYVNQAISFFKPTYLAIDIEVNQYYEAHPDSWNDMVDLHKFIYQKVKASNPNIIILPTIQYDHLKTKNAAAETAAVQQLMAYSDAVGLSTYPYSTPTYSLPNDYFNAALQFNKPVAISETGFPSQDFILFGESLHYTQDDQVNYFKLLLNFTNQNHSPFVVMFTGTDYDKLIPTLPQASQAAAMAYVYDGLRDSSGNTKKAYAIWQQYLKLPYTK